MVTETNTGPKSVAEALDLGIQMADAGHKPPPGVADDDTGGNDDDSTGDTGTAGAGEEGTSGGDDDGAAGTDDGTGTGSEGDGTPDPSDEAGTDATDGEGAADGDEGAAGADGKPGTKEGKPDAAGKKPDPLTDPIPNALKRETKERIRTLVDRTKTAETSLASVTSERDELINAVVSTGASPEQYAGVLDYLELVNSGDQNKLKKAANFMIRELSALSRVGGFRIPGVTSYAGHPDLEAAVKAGTLAPELAEELAAQRAASTHQGKVGAAQAQASAARKAYQEADQKARSDVNALEAEIRKTDPLYKEKQPIIIGMLNAQIKGDPKNGIAPVHPSKWPALFHHIYKTLPRTLGGMKPVNRNLNPGGKLPANQPLRTQQPAGATKPEPKSVAEALEMGIEMARGA